MEMIIIVQFEIIDFAVVFYYSIHNSYVTGDDKCNVQLLKHVHSFIFKI